MHFYSSQEEVLLTELYENHPSKIFAILFLAAMSVLASPIIALIVKFEREKSTRTLINQLMSNMLFLTSIPNFGVSILLFIRYSFVSDPQLICYLDQILRGSIIMNYILFLDAILIVRFIFVFHTKNPTATQDDFWNRFLCIWLSSISFICQFVFAILPGNNPNYFYICQGRVSPNHKNEKTKQNVSLQYLLLFSAVAHIFVGVRYFIFKLQEKKAIGTGRYYKHIIDTVICVSQSSVFSRKTGVF